jgi:negative regulator of sigma E activity
MNRANAAAVVFAAASLTFAGANPARDADNALLFAAIAAPSNVSYTGIVEVVRLGSRSAEAEVYRVEHRAPDLSRRVYTAPSGLSGDSVVSKGDLVFSIDSRRRRIVETSNDALDDSVALRANYTLLRENYRVVRKGSETFDGRPAIDLALLNKYSGRVTMLVRIDEASKLVLEKQEFAADGALVSELRFEEVNYTATIPAADFALPAPYVLVREAGASSESPDRAVSAAGFAAREPRSLPDGFSPVEGSLVEMRGVRTVHLLYSDGIRSISLFENAKASTLDATHPRSVRVGGRSAEYAEDGTMALLAWSDGTLYYTLVGEIGLVDLARIGATIAH